MNDPMNNHVDADTLKASVTTRGASIAGVDEATFCNWRWQMSHQIRSEADAAPWLSPGEDETDGFSKTKTLFNAGITPYYMALMGSHEDCPIRRQALPRGSELKDPIGIDDPLEEVGHSPVPEVVHVYPDRVAFCVAQLCPVYCRYCFRKRRDDEEGLHFNRSVVDRGIAYIASQPAIRDVLVTGGDPFIASDGQILGLVQRLREIPHVEIIRFGTRTPVTLPYRVSRELAEGLARFHPVFVNTHFNCVEELTPEAVAAVANLVNAGIPVGNQSVLLAGVNDSEDAMLALLRGLLKARVRPYYLFHPHRIAGTAHLRVPVERGLAIMRWLRGRITGLGLPSYVIDTPGGKVPVGPDYILGRDGEDLLMSTPRGDIWREQGVLQT
jgi:lysine 2,3-aminomutase